MIIYDQQNSRMVDTENGDYLLQQIYDRDGQWYFILYNRHDQPLFGSIVEVNNLDELGNSARFPTPCALSRCTLIKCWIPSGRREPPIYFDGDHPLIPRLAAFLKANHYHLEKSSRSRFEFIDGRHYDQRATAFAWAESYLQNPQTLPKSSVNGLDIFLGLLLTLALHCGQVLFLSFASSLNQGNNKWYFYFGFTQLFYILPAISYFRRRDRRGIVIGLIIGASLTFVLGLPLAWIGYICATNSGARLVH